MVSAFKAHELWCALSTFVLVLRLRMRKVPTFYFVPFQNNSMNALAAGIMGENSVVHYLHNQLGSEWTAIKGFQSRKGEADLIAVGPHGIAVIEIKSLNGAFSCNGDAWWRDKYDNYGNVVQHNVPIADKGGRSPSKQVNDVADEVVNVLGRSGVQVPVARLVILAHAKSHYGNFSNVTVHRIIRTEHLNLPEECARVCTPITAEMAGRVISLLQADHKRGAMRSRQRVAAHR
jgi:hypothetical protein